MAQTELADTSIIYNAGIDEHVVAIPIQPGKDIIYIKLGSKLSKGFTDVVQKLIKTTVAFTLNVPAFVRHLTFNKVIRGRFQLRIIFLFQIKEKMSWAD